MSSLQIGIVGLPNVGKSTLFNALTDSNILAANYPFATIEPNTGIVPVIDKRLHQLEELYSAKKIIPATVTFVDIAGLVAGASKGEGLGNQFLANIRSCNAICHVVRAFDDPDVLHVDQNRSTANDIEIINTELVLADLQTLEKKLPKIQKEAKSNPKIKPFENELLKMLEILNNNTPLNQSNEKFTDENVRDLQLLTLKPVIYAFNVDEQTLSDENKISDMKNLVTNSKVIFVCAKLESELRGLDEEDREELLTSYGVKESGLKQTIDSAYNILGLQSYLTAGEQEVRAWTIKKGATAPQAAGVIHGDFEKGFIAAQIINFNDLISAGSEQATKAQGKIRTEGKDYVMQEDDVVEFRFNVTK